MNNLSLKLGEMLIVLNILYQQSVIRNSSVVIWKKKIRGRRRCMVLAMANNSGTGKEREHTNDMDNEKRVSCC